MAERVRARLTASEGRRFGLTLGLAFAALGGLLTWRGHAGIALAAWVLAAGLIVGALAVPRHLGPVQRAWMAFGERLSRVTTPIFLAILFFVVLAPIGLVRRLFGRDPLRHAAPGGTYLKARPAGSRRSDLSRQF